MFAPDGSMYFADWHNVIIGHMQHNVRDPNRDHSHGRIYRMTAIGRPLQTPVKIDGQPIAALLDNLKSPVDGIRHRTRIELSERDSKEVIAATTEWLTQFDPQKKEDAHHLLEALWLHQQHNVREPQLLELVLNSPEPHARNAAKTVKHFWFNVEKTLRGGIIAEAALASSQNPRADHHPHRDHSGKDDVRCSGTHRETGQEGEAHFRQLRLHAAQHFAGEAGQSR
jgi:hypothetical protein